MEEFHDTLTLLLKEGPKCHEAVFADSAVADRKPQPGVVGAHQAVADQHSSKARAAASVLDLDSEVWLGAANSTGCRVLARKPPTQDQLQCTVV